MKIHHEVISIHPEYKTVSVKNLENGEIFEENYDKLISTVLELSENLKNSF